MINLEGFGLLKMKLQRNFIKYNSDYLSFESEYTRSKWALLKMRQIKLFCNVTASSCSYGL